MISLIFFLHFFTPPFFSQPNIAIPVQKGLKSYKIEQHKSIQFLNL